MSNNETDFAMNLSEGRQWAFQLLHTFQSNKHINQQIDQAETLAQYVINGTVPSALETGRGKKYDAAG